MQNSERFVGMGLAMVDEKIRKPGIILPPANELVNFLNSQTETVREIGGVTPNIISVLTAFAPGHSTRLLACVGEDPRGEFYRTKTSKHLGILQVTTENPTGIVASAIDEEGVVYQRSRHLGAAEKVKAPKEEMEEQTTLFLSDLTTIRLPEVFEESDKMLASLHGGKFFLNLAGLNPAIAPKDELVSVLTALKRMPDIVTGNESEFEYLTNSKDSESALQTFPDARILVLTRAGKGSLIRFEDENLEVPAYPVPSSQIVDETGAGDTYAGIMLGALHTKPYAEWTKSHVVQAGKTAAFGAALAVQTLRTRLTDAEMTRARNYHSHTS